jgi:uncharacterized protein (DUF1684 family)
MKRSKWFALLFASLIIAPTASLCAPAPGSGLPDYTTDRAARAKALTQPYGWLSLTALAWLKPGLTTVGSAPDNSVVLAGAPAHLATFEQKDGKVTLVTSSPSLTFHGQPLAPAHSLIGSGEDDNSALASGRLRMWVIDRSGRRYLRVKDPEAPTLRQFHGLRWYAPDQRFRIQARWVPDSPPHVMHVANEIGQVSPVSVPGHVEFELNGEKQVLWPLEAEKDGLWFVFRDQTYLQTTYGGGRFLTTDAPSNGLDHPGTVILDFNQAVNPPCAYSPFATCPLASREDRLPIAVPAGEKRYGE